MIVLDTLQLNRPEIIASTALETNDGVALFDTGPESTFRNIAGAMAQHGFSPNDVRHVFLSHIHLDHAGAAWRFAELGATIYVHPKGAPHLTNPAKLMNSAARIFGEEMGRLWGEMRPIPAEKIRLANDGDTFRAGEFGIETLATPGHASHHNVYHWNDHLFGGDVAGVSIGGGPPVPPFVPPELEIEAWLDSIAKMRATRAAHLYLPHFGLVRRPLDDYFDDLAERVSRWSHWFRDKMRAGWEDSKLIDTFAEYEANDIRSSGAPAERVGDYECADPSYMAVSAATRYWRKHHPEAVGDC